MPEEITCLPEVECLVEPGFLDKHVTVSVADEKNNRQYLEVPAGSVVAWGGKSYLPIGIVQLDYRKKRALIELPREADSGVRRLWIPFTTFRQETVEA